MVAFIGTAPFALVKESDVVHNTAQFQAPIQFNLSASVNRPE